MTYENQHDEQGRELIGGSVIGGPIPFSGGLDVFHDLIQNFTTNFAVDDKLDITAHGYANGLALQMTTSDTLPAGLSLATTYYVINQTANDFEVSLTPGGSAVDITSNGSGTHTANPYWVVPDGVTRIYAEVYGGGGGGGKGSSGNCGGGGGAGGATEGFLSVTPGTSMAVTIGAGGAGTSSADSDGSNGNDSIFSTLTGADGQFGSGAASRRGGIGTSGSGGDINMRSQAGGSGATNAGGHGGSNKRGGGGNGHGSTSGGPGGLFGGGGGGVGTGTNSGAGGDGGVIIWY